MEIRQTIGWIVTDTKQEALVALEKLKENIQKVDDNSSVNSCISKIIYTEKES